jgi:Holliday junction resolvase RusA-like endonuclease
VTRLTLCVPYAIRGASRPRADTRGTFARIHMPDAHHAAERDLVTLLADAVRAQGWEHVPRPGVIGLTIDVYTDRPKREMTRRWPDDPYLVAARPDADNVAKLTMDAGTKVGKPPKPKRKRKAPKPEAAVKGAAVDAGLWDDDTQVAALVVRRWRSAKGGAPMTMVVVERIPTGCPDDPPLSRTVSA